MIAAICPFVIFISQNLQATYATIALCYSGILCPVFI